MRQLFLLLILGVFTTTGALADGARGVSRLMRAIQMEQSLQVMQQEGLKYGAELARDFAPGTNTAQWAARVSGLYDLSKMRTLVEAEFTQAISGTDLSRLITFYESSLGQRIIDGEIRAREAFLDGDVEAAARQKIASGPGEDDPRVAEILAYITANQMVEYNVVGAMNSNLLFYRGMFLAGGMDVPEEDLLALVWGDEAETRTDSRDWLLAYLNTAYAGLSLDDLRSLTVFSETPEGQALNRALFISFDRMYEDLSFGLGLAYGASLQQGQEL